MAHREQTFARPAEPQRDTHGLRIELLGGFHILLDGQPVPTSAWRLQKARSLVKLLALAPGHRIHREHVMDQLWPDLEPDAAANNLYYALHVARRALASARSGHATSAGLIHFQQQVLSLYPAVPIWIDVDAFESAAAAARGTSDPDRYQTALDHYTGDLLPDDRYEDWCAARRAALRETHLSLLVTMARLRETQGAYLSAIEALQRVVEIEPVHEEAHVTLMRLYALTRQRSLAIRQYERLREALQRELGIEPDPASQQLFEVIQISDLTVHSTPALRDIAAIPDAPIRVTAPGSSALPPERPTGPPAPAPALTAHAARATPGPAIPLIGREDALARLRAAWRSVGMQPHLVALSGEAGIGKTRLADEALAWANSQRIATATARCYATTAGLAYAPVADWLRADSLWPAMLALDDLWLTETARVVPEILVERPRLARPGPLVEGWQRLRFTQALGQVFLQASQPLMLLLDDVQWCDRETLDWLHTLLHGTARAPLLIVCTLRPEDIGGDHPFASLAADLLRGDQLTQIALDRLDAQETATLAAQIAGQALDPILAAQLFTETEGLPLFIVQMAHASVGLLQREHPGDSGANRNAPVHGALPLPPTIQAAITERLARLSPHARELVGVAATIGRAFGFDLLARAASADEDTLMRGLDELWQRRVIRERGPDAYDFSHDKLREVAYMALSATRRRALHRRLAQALEEIHAGALDMISGQIADHYLKAGEPARAIEFLERAGNRARALFANDEAERYYRTLVRQLDELDRPLDAAHARKELAAVLTTTARYDEALATLEHAARAFDTAGDRDAAGQISARIGLVHSVRGTPKEGISLLQPLVESASALPFSIQTQIALVTALAQLYSMSGQYSASLAPARQAAQLAEAQGDDAALLTAKRLYGLALFTLGRPTEAVEVLDAVIRLAEASGALMTLAFALNNAGLAHQILGHLDQCHQYVERALVTARRTGDPTTIAFMLCTRGVHFTVSGAWAASRADFEAAAALSQAHHTTWASSHPPLGLGRLCMYEGKWDEAKAHLENSIALAASAGNLYALRTAHATIAIHDLLHDRPSAARAHLDTLLDRSGDPESEVTDLLPLLAWTYLDDGNLETAAKLLAQSMTRAAREQNQLALLDVLHIRAMLAMRQGNWQEAAALLDENLALARSIGCPYDAAKALYLYGRLHHETGHPTQARERLEAALAILSRLGERLYAERAQRLLASLPHHSAPGLIR